MAYGASRVFYRYGRRQSVSNQTIRISDRARARLCLASASQVSYDRMDCRLIAELPSRLGVTTPPASELAPRKRLERLHWIFWRPRRGHLRFLAVARLDLLSRHPDE